METKDLNNIGLAYLEMVEKRNIESKKNHAKTLDKVDPEELEGDHEDRDDKDIDNDGDVDSSDEYLHKKRKAVKKAIKKDDGDDQEKFKAYTGDDKNDQEGTKVSEDKEDKFEPHMMYDPKTGKGYKAEKEEDHLRMKKMGYTHDKPEEIDEASKEGTIRIIDLSRVHPDNKMGAKETSGHQVQRMTKGEFVNQGKPYAKKAQAEKERSTGQASMQFEAATMQMTKTADELNAYAKKSGGIDKGDFMKVARMLSTGKAGMPLVKFVNDMDTEPREKIITVMAKHMGQKTAEKMFNIRIREEATLMKTANESVNVDDVLALIDQGYTLDQAEAMVAEAACGTVNASVKPGTKAKDRALKKAYDSAQPKDKVSLKPMPAALAKKMKTDEELHGDQHKLDHNKDGKITAPDLAKVRKHGAVQKESVMNRVSNMVENIRADIQEKNEINEVSKGTLRDYAKKAVLDIDKQKADADKFEFRGMASQSRKVMDKNFKKSNRAGDKIDNRKAGINTAIDKLARESVKEGVPTTRKELQKYRFAGEYEKSGMKYPYSTADTSKADEAEARAMIAQTRTSVNKNKAKKESVQEAAKPTGIHHSTPVTAAQANDEQARGRWTDKAGRNTMTEKEFVDMHTIHPDVLPEFDGNVAAKKTAEAIKKAPKVSPTPNKNPTAGDKNKVKSTEAPAANAGVVGESYMDKYAKYIKGEI